MKLQSWKPIIDKKIRLNIIIICLLKVRRVQPQNGRDHLETEKLLCMETGLGKEKANQTALKLVKIY